MKFGEVKFVLPVLPVLTCAVLPVAGADREKQPERPNILFIMADEWRGDAVGYMGRESVQTPNMDRIAKQGVAFRNAVSHYPVSSPARAQLMTGMFPLQTRVTGNCNSTNAPYGVELQEDAVCWSDVLKGQGYSLGYIGKWHLDSPYTPYIDCSNNRGKVAWNEWCPPERRHGFDFWLSYGTYDVHMRPMYWSTDAGRQGFKYVDQWGPEFEADQAIAYLKNEGGKFRREGEPFALVVSMNPPHMDYNAVPKRYKQMYAGLNVDSIAEARPDVPPASDPMGRNFRKVLRSYYACVTGVDENIGRIVDALDGLGMGENTIVVITSDHGDCMGTNGQLTKNVIYDLSMVVPMVVRYPAVVQPRMEDRMISLMDLYPTMLGLAGLEDEVGGQVQGVDFSPLLVSGKGKYPSSQPYFRYYPAEPESGNRGVRTERYSYCLSFKNGVPTDTLLFDRKNDPYMVKNIAKEAKPGVYKKLDRELKQWLVKAHDPLAGKIGK